MAVGFGTQIKSNLATGYLLDAKQTRGGFTVVSDLTELNGLSTGSDGVVIVGSLAYNKYDDKFYQYKQTGDSPVVYGWVEKQFGGDTSDCVKFNANDIIDCSSLYFDDIIPTGDNITTLGTSLHRFYRGYIGETNTDNVKFTKVTSDTKTHTVELKYDSSTSNYNFKIVLDSGDEGELTLPHAVGTLATTDDIPSFGTTAGTMAEGNHTHSYLPLNGGTLSGGLGIATGSGISDASGNGMLVYHPSSWTGVTSSQWGVGAIDSQGVIRSSAANLVHYRGSTAYTIYDSYNYPSYDTAATASTVACRDSNGYLRCVYLNTSNSAENVSSYSNAVATFQSSDGWLRKTSFANFATALPFASQSQKGTIKIYASGDTLYINTQ